jgi:ABC-type lipoprotein export system ATPase subunit
VAIVGPSGSGKSTLLSCVLGLIAPRSGHITLLGTDLTSLSRRALAEHRRHNIGMIFQFGELIPELSPVDNVALAALLAGTHRKTAYRRAAELLHELGVTADGPAAYLSGGERQRTAVARALVNAPALILADEPTGALDALNRAAVADLIFALPRVRNCCLVVVTHDHTIAQRADRTLALDEGRLTPLGSREAGAR